MKIVSTFHAPTSVTHSLKCCLTDNTALEHLVVAKINQLEVFELRAEGLRLQCTQEIWGRVTSLKAILREASSSRSYLLLTLDHPDPIVLTFDYSESSSSGHPELVLISSENPHERGVRPAEFFYGADVNPRGNLAVISSYPGKLRVIELDDGRFQSSSDTGVREYNLIYMCFLRTSSQQSSSLAMLYFDHIQQLMLISYDLSISEIGTSFEASAHFPNLEVQDHDSYMLIPVPPHETSTWNNHGGVLVLGGSEILFYACGHIDRKKSKRRNNSDFSTDTSHRRRKSTAQVSWPLSELAAWAPVDSEGIRFLLGDNYGRIALLTVSLESQQLGLLVLGDVSPPTSLTALSSQYFYVGSHLGDSQIVRVSREKSVSDGSYLEVIESFKNIAPILDAVTLYPGDDDQPQVVTCSGGKSAGSLRVIRNGANFIEDAELTGLTCVTGVWPLKENFHDGIHTHLLISTPTSTQMVQIPVDSHSSPNSWSCTTEDIFPNISRSSRTLVAANMARRTKTPADKSAYEDGPYVVQVTPKAVILLNMKTQSDEARWTPERDIHVASVNASQICLGLAGGIVVVLVLNDNRIEYRQEKHMTPDNPLSRESSKPPEISAITVVPMKSSKFFSTYVAVGFYETHEVHVLNIRCLDRVGNAPVLPSLPCSLQFHDFGDEQTGPKPYLVAGMTDGSVALISFEDDSLGNCRIISFGDRPIHLTPCSIRKKETLIATGRRSSILYWAKDTIQHSPVLMKDAVFTSHLHTTLYPRSLVSVSSTGIIIGRVQDLDKIHIRTIFTGYENPVRIAHHPAGKVFGAGFHHVRPIEFEEEEVVASFRILDETTFETISKYAFEESEQLTALSLVTPIVGREARDCFAVGTFFYHKEEMEPRQGRLLIFTAGPTRESDSVLIATSEVRGCVYSIVSLEGKIAAAVNTGVFLYGIEQSDDANSDAKLVQLAEWNHNYFLTSLAVRNGLLVAGDALCSVTVLRLVNNKFQTVAKDYNPLMPLCVGLSEDGSIVGANSEGNLFSFIFPSADDETQKLGHDGSYHVDDNVNKLIPARGGRDIGSRTFTRQQMFFTSAGRIGLIIRIDDAQALHLSGLQRNLGSVIKSPGDIDNATRRAPVNARGRSDGQAAAFGFLDGDFIEHFLDYSSSSSEIQTVLDGKNEAEKLNWSYHQYREVLEELQGLH